MKAVRILIGIVAAVIAQSLLARLVSPISLPFDLILVAVVIAALLHGRMTGLLGGSLGGLAQDALSSGGMLGIGGMATSLAGFLAGYVGSQFLVTQALPRFVLLAGATLVNGAVFMGLYSLLGLRTFDQPYGDLLVQAILNAVIGVVLVSLIEYVPALRDRWRARRDRRRKAWYR